MRGKEHHTILRPGETVRKDHPVIRLRGMLDMLHASLVKLQVLCHREGEESLVPKLEDAVRLIYAVMGAEVKNCAMEPVLLGGMNEEQLRQASHNPAKDCGAEHGIPNDRSALVHAELNILRAMARQCELAAVSAFIQDRDDSPPQHEDILLALNRLSSYFYVLMCRYRAENEKIGGTSI